MLLGLSFSFLPLAILLPHSWLPIGLLGYVAYRARADEPTTASPDSGDRTWWGRPAILLSIGPLLAVALGSIFAEAAEDRQPALLAVLWTLGAADLGVALRLVWTSRPATGRMFVLTSLAMAWMASVILVGTMSITGHWL